jgi:hypothetical protein
MSRVKNCNKVKNYELCEVDEDYVNIGSGKWNMNIIFTALFIYDIVEVDKKVQLSDIDLTLNSLVPAIKQLAKGETDIHSGLWSSQGELFSKYLDNGKIFLKKSFLKNDESRLIVSKKSYITESDFNNKTLTIYTLPGESADNIALKEFIDEAGFSQSKFNIIPINEPRIYEKVECEKDAIGIASIKSSLFDTSKFRVLDIEAIFDNDFGRSNVRPAVSYKFKKTDLYERLKCNINRLRLTDELIADLEPRVSLMTYYTTTTLLNMVKEYKKEKGYTTKQLGEKIRG